MKLISDQADSPTDPRWRDFGRDWDLRKAFRGLWFGLDLKTLLPGSWSRFQTEGQRFFPIGLAWKGSDSDLGRIGGAFVHWRKGTLGRGTILQIPVSQAQEPLFRQQGRHHSRTKRGHNGRDWRRILPARRARRRGKFGLRESCPTGDYPAPICRNL